MGMMAHDGMFGVDVLQSSVYRLEKASEAVSELLCAI
jgi:hypothetical protein